MLRVVARVLRHQQPGELGVFRRDALLQVARLLGGQLAHLGVGAGRHLLRGAQLVLEAAELAEALRHRLEARVLHRQLAELALPGDDVRVGEQRAHFLEALDRPLQTASDRLLHQSCGWSSR